MIQMIQMIQMIKLAATTADLFVPERFGSP